MIDKRGENGPTQRGPRRVKAHRGWSPAAGLSGCSVLPPRPALPRAGQPGARPSAFPFRARGRGPLAAASGSDCGGDDPGPFRAASFSTPPHLHGCRAQPHSLTSRPVPGGLQSAPPANTAEETKDQWMAICISFEYCPRKPAPSQACSSLRSPRCPFHGPHPHWLGFTIPVF